ncbi:MAG: hypothetical protein GWN07_13195, partial [Actinobacteria bacterium]|nr:hypothetical protein [Actinomycetota bacterium]NIS31287.1 hypothetical protein [Actinomycetota bacterium]NIT98565.1 hypothetical protein [Actinomycetota bacterium]NIU66407.1 hypothetical protein [Actinomycetota bacterium]NIW28221.1 hypothetical protein [Actinomycetota bacterium]
MAGEDGSGRLYGAAVGGEEIVALPTGGVPLRDVAVNPAGADGFEVATLGVNGQLRLWPYVFEAETTVGQSGLLYPTIGTAAGEDRYFVNSHTPWRGLEDEGAYQVFAGDGTEIFRHPTLTSEDWILRGAAISADGAVGAFTGPDGHIHVADLDTGSVTV